MDLFVDFPIGSADFPIDYLAADFLPINFVVGCPIGLTVDFPTDYFVDFPIDYFADFLPIDLLL